MRWSVQSADFSVGRTGRSRVWELATAPISWTSHRAPVGTMLCGPAVIQERFAWSSGSRVSILRAACCSEDVHWTSAILRDLRLNISFPKSSCSVCITILSASNVSMRFPISSVSRIMRALLSRVTPVAALEPDTARFRWVIRLRRLVAACSIARACKNGGDPATKISVPTSIEFGPEDRINCIDSRHETNIRALAESDAPRRSFVVLHAFNITHAITLTSACSRLEMALIRSRTASARERCAVDKLTRNDDASSWSSRSRLFDASDDAAPCVEADTSQVESTFTHHSAAEVHRCP